MLKLKESRGALSLCLLVGALTACGDNSIFSGSNFSGSNLKSNSGLSVGGILGGVPVAPTDPIAHSTVIVMTITADPTHPGMEKIGTCTGNLISSNLVLTAGHCSNPTTTGMWIVFSDTLPIKGKAFKTAQKRPVVAEMTTPQWPTLTANQNTDWGDLSILKFDGQLPAGYTIATLDGDTADLKDGMDLTLAGYGLVNGIKDTQTSQLRMVGVTMTQASFSRTEFLINQTDGKGACHGDSGGPAYAVIAGKQVIVGITSRGNDDPNNTCEENSIYTSVPAWLSWIKETATTMSAPNFKTQKIAEPAASLGG